MGRPHTTIGAERFHFRVRNGIGWFPLAIAARKFGLGVKVRIPSAEDQAAHYLGREGLPETAEHRAFALCFGKRTVSVCSELARIQAGVQLIYR